MPTKYIMLRGRPIPLYLALVPHVIMLLLLLAVTVAMLIPINPSYYGAHKDAEMSKKVSQWVKTVPAKERKFLDPAFELFTLSFTEAIDGRLPIKGTDDVEHWPAEMRRLFANDVSPDDMTALDDVQRRALFGGMFVGQPHIDNAFMAVASEQEGKHDGSVNVFLCSMVPANEVSRIDATGVPEQGEEVWGWKVTVDEDGRILGVVNNYSACEQ